MNISQTANHCITIAMVGTRSDLGGTATTMYRLIIGLINCEYVMGIDYNFVLGRVDKLAR